MRRALLPIALLLACCDEPYHEWGDEPGIDVCAEVIDRCKVHCEDGACGELFGDCGDFVRDREGLVDRVPGLHHQLTLDVALGRKRSCVESMAYLEGWRFE